MKQKIVIALGGNALGESPSSQKEAVKLAVESIVDLIEQGNDVMVVHGNGPQVGMIHLAFTTANKTHQSIPLMPFVESTAMSQGYIGYHLQNALINELEKRSVCKSVVTVLTQVEVDENDTAFSNPSKPVGPFYTKKEAQSLSKKENAPYIEDAGRGYRKVVPSPKPQTVVEKKVIQTLLNQGFVVVSNGGGGIPVLKQEQGYVGVEAVIDKDFSASKIADEINADTLIILTGVPKVAINYGKKNQEWLNEMNVDTTLGYIKEGHFAPGSMLPKVEASIQFVKGHTNRQAMITSLENASRALIEKDATIIKGP